VNDAAIIEPDHPPDDRPAWAPLTIVAFIVLVIFGYVATAGTASLSTDNPELFIALSARVRNLLLALGGGIGVVPYVLIGAARLALAYTVCHLIGRVYGTSILELFGRYLGVKKEQMDAVFDSVGKVEWLVIPFFVGSNLVAAITGIKQMAIPKLVAYVGIGIAGRLALYYWLSKVFEDELDRVLDFFRDYTRPAVIVSLVLVVLVVGLNVRGGRGFKL